MIGIILPWPPKSLSPNARVHWTKKRESAAAYRREGAMATLAGTLVEPNLKGSKAVLLDIEFVAPDRRPRDLDNMLASIKSGLDGVADVLQVNDYCFEFKIRRSLNIGGMVKITITKVD
jgi:crossover junction endodeoxyribonuclease RusA